MESNNNTEIKAVKPLSERVQLDEKLRTAHELGCLTAAKHADEALEWISKHIFDSWDGVTIGFSLNTLNLGVAGVNPCEVMFTPPDEIKDFVAPARNAYWDSYFENLPHFLGLKKPLPTLCRGFSEAFTLEDFN